MMNVATAYGIVEASKNARKQEVFVFRDGSLVIEAIGIEKFRSSLVRNKDAYTSMNNMCIDKILEGMRSIADDELEELAEDAIVTKHGDDDDDDYTNNDDGPVVTSADEETETSVSSAVVGDIQV